MGLNTYNFNPYCKSDATLYVQNWYQNVVGVMIDSSKQNTRNRVLYLHIYRFLLAYLHWFTQTILFDYM